MIPFPVYLRLPLVYHGVNMRNLLVFNELQRFVYLFTNFPRNGEKEKDLRGQNDFPRADHERFFSENVVNRVNKVNK